MRKFEKIAGPAKTRRGKVGRSDKETALGSSEITLLDRDEKTRYMTR